MPQQGWQRLVADWPWFHGPESYPIAAYSEFMPPPRVGRKPYGSPDELLFDPADPWGWHVTEYEESLELQPGLECLAKELLHVFRRLGQGDPAHGIAKRKLDGNPYWPKAIARTGAPKHERYVLLLSLALSRTQDDKGRVRWTLFGTSEQGPGRPFWRGFFTTPRREQPIETSLDFIRRLLTAAYGERPEGLADLRRAGFRIYSSPAAALLPYWDEGPLPRWTEPFRWQKGQTLRGVRYLLTFCPLERLPRPVERAYLAGDLHLLPFPGSLVHFGTPPYLQLERELPMATQIPLLHSLQRHEGPLGIRVPQSGWLHEGEPGAGISYEDYGPMRATFQRTHRWQRVHRHENHLEVLKTEDKLAHVLLSTEPDDVGLYNKPMARNSQIWTHEFDLLLDGPRATPEDLVRAAHRLAEGGLFGYRMLYPAMRVGRHEVYWHRPLVAYFTPETDQPSLLPDAPRGYLTAYPSDRPRLDRPVELWARMLDRKPHQDAVRLLTVNHEHRYRQTMYNVRKLLDTWQLLGRKPLAASFARQLLTLPKHESLEDWFAALPGRATDSAAAGPLIETLRQCVATQADGDWSISRPQQGATGVSPVPGRSTGKMPVAPVPRSARQATDPEPVPCSSTWPHPSITFEQTARRSFEKKYWNTIAQLATGQYVNKDNADCVLDPKTQVRLVHHHRDLEALGDYLLKYYEKEVGRAGLADRALVGELPFRWQTDFHFTWSGGWCLNQESATHERDLVVVIPGRDRRRAVIMADHYDTAYMEDVYGYGDGGGGGPRLAAAGADDNHSATAALMLAAPIFLELSREGRLDCDIWLVHLTGEEFPADCMGARHLCQRVVQGDMKIHQPDGRWRNLARTRVQGVYVLDMVAHNNEHDPDIFQISPGLGRESMWLAEQAHAANHLWNASTAAWNRRAGRRGRQRGRRSADGRTIPEIALHPQLYGEVRPAYCPRSSLYNTDGQIFSDAGVPVVLFMENYDINRKGYHDTHDTLANIDLDFGAAVAAIAIESVARAATQKPI
jgi:hypothetical protein